MALIVEDGTGMEDAQSFISVADADTYHVARGNQSWAGASTEQKEQALIRATSYIDAKYGRRWAGSRTYGRDQALSWPRSDVIDGDGIEIEDDEIPREVRDATAEVALRELLSPGSLTPDVVPSERVVSETVGPISTKYADPGDAVEAVTPQIPYVEQLLENLIESQGGSGSVFVLRA